MIRQGWTRSGARSGWSMGLISKACDSTSADEGTSTSRHRASPPRLQLLPFPSSPASIPSPLPSDKKYKSPHDESLSCLQRAAPMRVVGVAVSGANHGRSSGGECEVGDVRTRQKRSSSSVPCGGHARPRPVRHRKSGPEVPFERQSRSRPPKFAPLGLRQRSCRSGSTPQTAGPPSPPLRVFREKARAALSAPRAPSFSSHLRRIAFAALQLEEHCRPRPEPKVEKRPSPASSCRTIFYTAGRSLNIPGPSPVAWVSIFSVRHRRKSAFSFQRGSDWSR